MKMKIKKKQENKNILIVISFIIIMIVLGVSDSLRGLFALIFKEHYSLSNMELSTIITVSYIGNLIFLCFGGSFLDRYQKKNVVCIVLSLWIAALAVYILTDNYYCLLLGMLIAMGASTLLNTAINLLTPTLFPLSSGLMVNLFFFTQGIGTSASQKIVGRFASNYGDWKLINMILLAMGVFGLFLMLSIRFSENKNTSEVQKQSSIKGVVRNSCFLLLVLLFGFYFIAEHGIMNWMISYCNSAFHMSMGTASGYLSIFFGGITLGRLLWAPLVQKMGTFKSIRIFGGIGTALFILGIFMGNTGIMVLSISGIAISILYPTMVLTIQSIYPKEIAATATGFIISIATIFDICFNGLFGYLIDAFGYRNSFIILPFCMAGFYLCYLNIEKRRRV